VDKKQLLSKQNLEQTLQQALTQYLQTFYQNNFQNKLSEELLTGMGVKMIPEIMKAVDSWIPKEENETKEV